MNHQCNAVPNLSFAGEYGSRRWRRRSIVILLCGIPSESSQSRLADALDALGADYRFVNQRRVGSSSIVVEHDGASVGGVLEHDGWSVDLAESAASTCASWTTAGCRSSPASPRSRPRGARAARSDIVGQRADVSPATTITATPDGLEFLQPFGPSLGADGFAVPERLVTNDPELVSAFVAEHGTRSTSRSPASA